DRGREVPVLGDLGPAASKEISWVRSDLRSPELALKRTLKHWNLTSPIPSEYTDRIRKLLAPTVIAAPLLREVIEDVNAGLLRLTNEQITIMRGLRRNRRAIVYGGAGTGKTILALEESKRLHREGFSVLLLCYNRPLADEIGRALNGFDGITTGTFHAFC